MVKTAKEVEEQIERLRQIRDKIIPESMFGTNNVELLDTQIDVLEDNTDEDMIWCIYGEDDEDMDVRSSALEARAWMDGDDKEDLDKGYPML